MIKTRILSGLRIAAEIAALAAFILFFLNHKLQMWIFLFGGAAVFSVIFGRFYCSWICPMNMSFKLIGWIYSKLKIKRFKTPGFLKNDVIRISLLILFIAAMIVTKKLGMKVNILLYLTLFSIFITLIFEENFWHRRLCPFGSILSLTSRPARYRLEINEEKCISCGKCQIVCPSDSIITLENRDRRNINHECLLCRKCIEVCPKSVCEIKL